MRPIIIQSAVRSTTAQQIVKQLNATGVTAYYGDPPREVQNPLVLHWAGGGYKNYELARLTAARVPTLKYSHEPRQGWLGRRATHAQAKDFTNPPANPDFWTEPVFTNHEFRVHVIHDYAFRTQYKYLPEGTRALVVNGVPIRNHILGWRFSPHPEERFQETTLTLVRDTARAAVRALGYDMGAVDVGLIVGSNGLRPDRALVFEVNTRPEMDEHTRGAYVGALIRLAQK